MNLQQAKILFFAQYLGQRIDFYDELYGNLNNSSLFWYHLDQLENEYRGITLLLRTVDQLTDDEYTQFAKICIPQNSLYVDHIDGKNIIDYFVNRYSLDSIKMIDLHSAISYLYLIGILLPFTYLNEENKPATLQPAEIISLGWIRIK